MNIKAWFKRNKTILILVTIVLAMTFVVPVPKFAELDFYEFHVWECEQAHAQNMSFNVWSGFCYEPTEEHLSIPWIIHPSENPRTHIAHGSNLGTGKWIVAFGVYGWLTSPQFYTDENQLSGYICFDDNRI